MSFVVSHRTALDMAAGPQAVSQKEGSKVSFDRKGRKRKEERTDYKHLPLSVRNKPRHNMIQRRPTPNNSQRVRNRAFLLEGVPILRGHLGMTARVEVRRRREFLYHQIDGFGGGSGHSAGYVELDFELDAGFEGGFGGAARREGGWRKRRTGEGGS
jgi:hypothetical protein